MSDYRPPLRDIRFVLEHIVDLGELSGIPGFEHVEAEDVYDALDEAGRFFSEVVAPTNRIGDEQGITWDDDGSVTVPGEVTSAYRQFVDAGWGAVSGDMEYGGHGFPGVMSTAIQEMLTSSNMAFSLCPMLTSSAVKALSHHGSEELNARYLEKLITGEWAGTMALTEPEAGSDVGALRAKAWQEDDGTWRVQGTKIFITWGEHEMTDNIIHFVLARAPEAPPGTRGISLFLVPKYLVNADGSLGDRNDVECIGVEHKLGIHASPTCVMAYGEQRGATAYLVGDVNAGMRCMFTMMNDARLHVGLEGLGLSVRAYQLALEYARDRKQGRAIGAPKGESSPIIEHPDVRRMLMTLKANIEAMRALVYDASGAGDRRDHGADEGARLEGSNRMALLTPVAKAWATDLGVDLTSLGVQIHGGMGFVEEAGAAQHWRDSRIAPIYDGTNIVCVATGFGQVLRGVQDLRQFGVVAGGYYLAKSALIAKRLLEEDGSDPWLQAKIDTAAFYSDQILPQAAGAAPAVTVGAVQLFAIDSDMLGQ